MRKTDKMEVLIIKQNMRRVRFTAPQLQEGGFYAGHNSKNTGELTGI